jgi:hypothetical protein
LCGRGLTKSLANTQAECKKLQVAFDNEIGSYKNEVGVHEENMLLESEGDDGMGFRNMSKKRAKNSG